MARKLTKAQDAAVVWLFLILIVIGGIVKATEAMGSVTSIIVIVAGLGSFFLYKKNKRDERYKYLTGKYNDEGLVSNIMGGHFWEGQTADQLVESIGQPVEVDEKQLKTKRKEVWKYGNHGRNRYGLRITVENGVVVGWDKKAS